MRIVSGKNKGRRISAPGNLPVRPTTDMAKEALFNILNNHYYFEDTAVLDLFSGIGSICLEFASRGSVDIIAVDAHHGCIKFIDKTNMELGSQIQTIKSDVFSYLERCNRKFDLIFADPPYDLDIEQFKRIIHLVFEKNLLNEDGMLIVEHRVKSDLSAHLKFDQVRKYGSSSFSFFTNKKVE